MKPISSHRGQWIICTYSNLSKNLYHLFGLIKIKCYLRLYFCLAVLLSTTNCVHGLKTKDFDSNNTSAVFKLNINYDGQKTAAENHCCPINQNPKLSNPLIPKA